MFKFDLKHALGGMRLLRDAFTHLAKPHYHKLIAKNVTFSCNVSLPKLTDLPSYPRLYLAGDYTYADYPATIEGAVRSGINAADYIINP